MKKSFFILVIIVSIILFTSNIRESEVRHRINRMDSENSTVLQDTMHESNEKIEKKDVLSDYYGCYKIVQFCFTQYYSSIKYDVMTEQEADMLLGRIVFVEPDLLVTYDSERALGMNAENGGFDGNYMIKKYIIENPSYKWELLTADTVEDYLKPNSDMEWALGKDYYEQLEGIITLPRLASPYGTQFYYTMKDKTKLAMYSTLTNQYYILEKCDMLQEKSSEIEDDEKKIILEKIYGKYDVVEFIPTKYYPAADSGGYTILPKEEADLMIGKQIEISEDIFITYDNFRLPNSSIMNRIEDGYWIEKVEIKNPEYQIERKPYNEIYGIRDDILPDELWQQEYIEINVFPGYETKGARVLPQLYLMNDGKIVMYSMGEYFLLNSY